MNFYCIWSKPTFSGKRFVMTVRKLGERGDTHIAQVNQDSPLYDQLARELAAGTETYLSSGQDGPSFPEAWFSPYDNRIV